MIALSSPQTPFRRESHTRMLYDVSTNINIGIEFDAEPRPAIGARGEYARRNIDPRSTSRRSASDGTRRLRAAAADALRAGRAETACGPVGAVVCADADTGKKGGAR